MLLKNKYQLFALISFIILSIIAAVIYYQFWRNLSPEEQVVLGKIVKDNIGPIFIAFVLIVFAFGLAFDQFLNTYVLPLKRTVEELSIVTSVNSSHRISLEGSSDLESLAGMINKMADRIEVSIAEHVGTDLLSYSPEIIVENGGDIFLKLKGPITVGIYAGTSPLSMRVGLKITGSDTPMGVCTSSGTVGHSLSMGKADAVCVVSQSCALADAAATSIGNMVGAKTDIQQAVDAGKTIKGVTGLVVIMGDKIGLWGELEVVPLKGKKG